MKQVLLASLLAVISCGTWASPIDNLIEQYLPFAHVGLLVQDASSQELIYSKNTQQSFAPASVTKSFTSAATLVTLDQNFSYITSIGYNQDDLVLIFTGDPSFTREDLIALLQKVNVVNGDIIINNTHFPKPDEGRGWVAEDLNWYFGTPAKTVIINENQIPIQITPSKTLGQKVELKVLHEDFIVPISHEVITVSEQEANTLCQLNLELNPLNNGVHFYGCWPKGQSVTLKVGLANPELRVEQIILETLKAQNVAFNGEVKNANAAITKPLASHQSAPLSVLNQKVMKQSNNLYADSLVKTLGQQNYNRGTLQAGSYAMLTILKEKLGVNSKTILLSDGSGGSIYNEVTPKDVGLLLQKMYDSPYQQDYLTLQKVDADHTFYSRLPENFNTPLYLKTGSMTGVSNLAGYIKTKSGKTLIFVCLLNSLPKNKSKVREFEQAFIHYLASL